jgi:hypothetical protein
MCVYTTAAAIICHSIYGLLRQFIPQSCAANLIFYIDFEHTQDAFQWLCQWLQL